MEKLTLPHRLPTLAALAPTPSPLLQQRFMEKETSPEPGPRPDCSVIPGTPSPEQSGQIPGGFHETMRQTTAGGRRYAALPVGERLAVLGAMMAVEAQR